jgi:hypothetical protein
MSAMPSGCGGIRKAKDEHDVQLKKRRREKV